MAKKKIKKTEEKKETWKEVKEVEAAEAFATLEDIKFLHELALTITARIDRIVAAISKAKSIKGM